MSIKGFKDLVPEGFKDVELLSPRPTVRPKFGKRQITRQRQLCKGRKIRVHKGSYNALATVIGRPFKINGILWISLKFSAYGTVWEQDISLSDHSVIRYEDRTWNTVNWLEKA